MLQIIKYEFMRVRGLNEILKALLENDKKGILNQELISFLQKYIMLSMAQMKSLSPILTRLENFYRFCTMHKCKSWRLLHQGSIRWSSQFFHSRVQPILDLFSQINEFALKYPLQNQDRNRSLIGLAKKIKKVRTDVESRLKRCIYNNGWVFTLCLCFKISGVEYAVNQSILNTSQSNKNKAPGHTLTRIII